MTKNNKLKKRHKDANLGDKKSQIILKKTHKHKLQLQKVIT